ncbi:MAG: thioredoxin-disulfide reductase [Nanoarchaeota archaeon]|nr:thioredoxin-disulfide reductase [Nanoarchaeota archaeon]MBU1643950.1 thioredoxin-disulfide reductase [Nanoarchaeota archaeon]MBU1977387.1 thioredoxin-disulfide reductase [Nanoarchaeota archaeon]
MENVIILGSGIAGCTAAIYAARANLSPLVFSGPQEGGQLTMTTEVENFPGFPEGIRGMELVEKAKKQAEKFGATFKTDIATEVEEIKNGFELTFMSGAKLKSKTIIVATGASARWLGIPSEEKYRGRGVTTCATCDGAFFKDKEVIVVGGGDSAMEESLFLTRFAAKVTVVHRREELRASKFMQEKAQKNEKIEFVWNSMVSEILGDGRLVNGVKLKNLKTGKLSLFKCDGVFLAIGHVPNTRIFQDKIKLDDKGYIVADKFMRTSIPGIFAAGDVQDTRFKQAITAAGSGCKAAMEVEKYLAENE